MPFTPNPTVYFPYIRFRDTDITGWPSHKVCDLGIGQVAEGRQVFPTLSVAENLDMGAWKGVTQRLERRQSKNEIADGAAADYQNPVHTHLV